VNITYELEAESLEDVQLKFAEKLYTIMFEEYIEEYIEVSEKRT